MNIELTTTTLSRIISKKRNPMKAVKLTQHINYLSMEDEEGSFGLMMLNTSNPKMAEIHSEEDFIYWYNEFNAPFQ